MDPDALIPVLSTIFAIGAVAVAALIVGRSRGLREVDTKSDAAAQNLIRDLESRVALLERERIEAAGKIAQLESKVRTLETDLATERAAFARAITKHFQAAGDPEHG